MIGDDWLEACHQEGTKQGERRLDDPADFVRIEVEAALARDIPVVPVLVGRASMPSEEQLPPSLSDLSYRNAVEVRSGQTFGSHVDRLIKGLEHILKARLGPAAADEMFSGENDTQQRDENRQNADEVSHPQQIGRYRVERVLGQGGFGLVYLAHDDQLQRAVAVKVPHKRLVSDSNVAEQYLAEARTVASLDHVNIVPVHDVGSTDEFPCYFVSKYIEGESLAA